MPGEPGVKVTGSSLFEAKNSQPIETSSILGVIWAPCVPKPLHSGCNLEGRGKGSGLSLGPCLSLPFRVTEVLMDSQGFLGRKDKG